MAYLISMPFLDDISTWTRFAKLAEEFVVWDGKCYMICSSILPDCLRVAFYRLGGVIRLGFDACTVNSDVHYLLFHLGACSLKPNKYSCTF